MWLYPWRELCSEWGRAPLPAFFWPTLRPAPPYWEGDGPEASSHASGVGGKLTCLALAERRPLPESGRLKWEAGRGTGGPVVRKQALWGSVAPTGTLKMRGRGGGGAPFSPPCFPAARPGARGLAVTRAGALGLRGRPGPGRRRAGGWGSLGRGPRGVRAPRGSFQIKSLRMTLAPAVLFRGQKRRWKL